MFDPALLCFDSEMKMHCRKQVVFWNTDSRGILLIFSPLMKMLHEALLLGGGLLTDA